MSYETFQSGPRKGQPKTYTDRIVRYITDGLGYKETISKNKYRLFRHLSGKELMVGSSGAVRIGRTIQTSRSLTDAYKVKMELWEQDSQNAEAATLLQMV